MHNSVIYDVVIAGAGPVGLFLACELRLAELSVLVLEQAPDPASPLKCLPFGMRGLSSPTIEAFYRRGLLDAIVAKEIEQGPASASAHWMQQARHAGGHFAGIQFYKDRLDHKQWPYRLDGPCPTNIASDMAHLESLLARRAIALGVEIRRDTEVEGFSQSGNEVVIRTPRHTIRAGWLVGCDGGRSTVRRAGDFGFTGTEPEFTGYSAQIELANPDQLATGRHYTSTGMYTYQQSGILAMVDFDGGAFHRTQPITLDHVQAVLRHVSGIAVTVTALKLATTWTDRAFQAQTYRKGRVLLAGDAAHIHSPLGGQGLNLGLGDAMNLGWKLAATIRGNAPHDLLDSYHTERHPIGAQILNWSRAQVELMRPSQSSRALADIMCDLIETPNGATYFADRVWGLSLRYDLGDNHPLIGRSAPDFEMANGFRLGEHLRHGNGVLLDFSTDAALQSLARGWDKRIAYIGSNAREKLGLTSILVRPDGIVAWVGEGPLNKEMFCHAATRWFGDAGAPAKLKHGS